MLEDRPFMTMIHDDNPWAEGLMFTVILGVAVGLAGLIGGVLTSATLPPSAAIFPLLLQVLRQSSDATVDLAQIETTMRQLWQGFTILNGYDSGWVRLLLFVWTPLGMVLQWLVTGLVVHLVAKAQGGNGSLNQTLGATALMAAPAALRVLSIVPFVSVSGLLILVWSVLILFRALEVAHDLPWRRAAVTALVPVILLLVVLGVVETVLITLIATGGVA